MVSQTDQQDSDVERVRAGIEVLWRVVGVRIGPVSDDLVLRFSQELADLGPDFLASAIHLSARQVSQGRR